jgi:surfactin synthase thioesterase subunit
MLVGTGPDSVLCQLHLGQELPGTSATGEVVWQPRVPRNSTYMNAEMPQRQVRFYLQVPTILNAMQTRIVHELKANTAGLRPEC